MSKRFTSHNGHDNGERGFTLVEILTAMVILLIIVTACFPLFSMATKTTYENKARIIAAELAKQEIEKTLSLVTPANYYSNSGPLETAVIITENENGYIITRNVEWIDDPEDGVYPDDLEPFDFKRLIVEVSYPSLFSGPVTRQMDFDTYVAREGSASPVTGLIVQVNNLLNSDPVTEPVSGAYISFINLDTGEEDHAVADANGAAFFDVLVPENDADGIYTLEVTAESSGLIMDPSAVNVIEVQRDMSNNMEIAMAKPAQITVKCKSPQGLSRIELTGTDYNEEFIITESDLNSNYVSKSFNNLWPFSAYQVNATLAVHKAEFAESFPPENFEESPPDGDTINIWKYQNAAAPFDWSAKPDDYTPDVVTFANNHYLKYLLDLSAYHPADSAVTVSSSFLSPFNETVPVLYIADQGSEADSFVVLKVNKTSSSHAVENAAVWQDVINIGDLDNLEELAISLPNSNVVLSDAFALLFRTSPDIAEMTLNSFYIMSEYQGNITLDSPGEDFTLNLTE